MVIDKLEPQGQPCAKCGGSGSTDATMSMNCKDCDGTGSVPQGQALPVADDKTLPFEKALAELIDKIDSGLDTGDILEGARLASVALDAIMTGGDLVSNAHDYFRDTDRYKTSVDFRIGWNACLDAIGRARTAFVRPGAAQPVADERDAERLEWVSHAWGGQRHDYANHVLSRGGDGDLSDIRTFIDKHLPARAALCQPAEKGDKA